jgi:TRAP transporter TAXI family solute receptor
MKRIITLLITLAMILSLLAGCTSSTNIPADPGADNPIEDKGELWVTTPINLRYATQGAGTANYTNAASRINILLKYLPAGSNITQETISTGNSSVGYLIEADLADVGDGENAAAGTVGFNGRPPYSKVNALQATKTQDFVMMITTQKFYNKTGYTSIREVLENKYPATLCCEDVGSSDYTCLLYTFEILGYTFEEFEDWGGRIVTTSGDACCEMLQDNQADMMIGHCSTESSSIVELGITTDVIMTSIDNEIIEGFKERGFGSAIIPTGAFDRFEEDTPSAAIGSCFIVGADMDDATAYTLTRILCEHLDEFAEEISGYRNLTYAEMVDNSVTVVPLHPGAIKYYQEIGVLDTNGNYVGEPF